MSRRDIIKTLGHSVRQYRKDAALSQDNLAKRAGLSISTIRRLEQGISAPSLRELEKISAALTEPLSTLFEHTEKYEEDSVEKRSEIRKIDHMLRQHTVGELKILRDIIRDVFELQRLKNR